MNSIPALEALLRDLRYAVRVLRRSPGFTITVIVTLALAIGINTAVFSIVDAVLLRPLPYPEPERLALMLARVEAGGARGERTSQNGVAWVTVRDHATTVDRAVFSTWPSGVNVVAGSQAVHADQQKVSANFFKVLGVQPLIGREFSPDEDRPGGPAAVILGHDVWRSMMGGDRSIVGRAITLRGQPYTVVGVMPPRVQTGAEADLWTPLRAGTSGEGGGENYQVLFRMHPGVSQAAVDAEMVRLGPEINRRQTLAEGTTITYGTVPLQRGLTEPLRRPLLMLWTAVGIVLLLACVNLAGLQLARGAGRTREMATRLALGSRRTAIVRQLLVESLVLAVAGAGLGLVLGAIALDTLKGLAEHAFDLWQPIGLDARAAGAAAIFALLSTAFFGLYPALQGTRAHRLPAASARAVAGPASHLPRRLLVATQIALGVVLLVGAGVLLRSFAHLRGLDPGFNGQGVYTATVSLQDARYQTTGQVNALVEGTLTALRSASPIESAAVSLGLPYERLLNLGFRHLDGAEATGDARITSATYVAGDYFGTLRIPLRAGRVFDTRDAATGSPVAIVNETIAREYFGGANPVGRRIRFAGAEREIIGVVGDVQVRPGFGDRGPIAPMPLAYVPLSQVNDATLRLVHGWFATSFIVRTQGSMGLVMPLMRAAVVDPMLPFAQVRSMAGVASEAVALPRLLMVLLLALASAAIVLTAVGIHGLIASSVTERTREMGIRLALGATTAHAVRTLALPGLLLAVAGTMAGIVAARGAVGAIQGFVWGVSPTDPRTFIAVTLIMIVVATAASVLPALRILRLDPAITLRAE